MLILVSLLLVATVFVGSIVPAAPDPYAFPFNLVLHPIVVLGPGAIGACLYLLGFLLGRRPG